MKTTCSNGAHATVSAVITDENWDGMIEEIAGMFDFIDDQQKKAAFDAIANGSYDGMRFADYVAIAAEFASAEQEDESWA